MGDKLRHLNRALRALGALPGVRVRRTRLGCGQAMELACIAVLGRLGADT